MNTESLHVALQQSFNPDTNQRRPAEEIIKGLKHVEGASLMLLEIAAEKQVNTTPNTEFSFLSQLSRLNIVPWYLL